MPGGVLDNGGESNKEEALNFVKRYLIPRLIQYFLVIFLGITIVFIIPRLSPSDPVLETIAALQSRGASLDPSAVESMIEDLKELYGLKGSMFGQYISFWKRVFTGDFGVSFFQFPTPVIELISQALPWTVVLLLLSTILNWVIGNVVGGMVGYFSRKRWAKVLDGITMVIRPIPYYILALLLLILFAYVFKLFPIGGGTAIGRKAAFNIDFIRDVLRHVFLPALSMIILGGAVNYQTMRLIVQTTKDEDFVKYAQMGGLKENIIVLRYVIRNAILPQITNLALSLGGILSGALITEIVFSYPGMGTLLYHAIVSGDYNLIIGILSISILALATSVLIIDLLYPLFDPRIRYR